ncbi:MAG: hypothetical protein DSY42_04635 [Aquifex sp.]|nr:MAG: hypothetical protein DSY42_04635 [Aquifex sp.]
MHKLALLFIGLFFINSCEEKEETLTNPLEFFLKNYNQGIYRYLVLDRKYTGKNRCKVIIKDLQNERKYSLMLYVNSYLERLYLIEQPYCELFTPGIFIEIAGERFTPLRKFKIFESFPLEDKLFLWVFGKPNIPVYTRGNSIFTNKSTFSKGLLTANQFLNNT